VKVKYHIAASGIVSYMVYIMTNSLINTAASFAAGILIDCDHCVDYYLNHGFTYDMRKIYDAMSNVRITKVYLLLHSYELLLASWALAFLHPLNGLYLAISIGFTHHIIFDQIYNPLVSKGYFLSYRIAMGFRKESIIDTQRLKRLYAD